MRQRIEFAEEIERRRYTPTALKAYLAAPVEGGPAPANAHYRLGMIAEKRGAKGEARTEYQAALRLNPESHVLKRSPRADAN
jgi:hypothetical protein